MVPITLVEQLLSESDLAADTDVRYSENERGHGSRSRLHVERDMRAGLILAEALLPVLAQVAVLDVVAAPHPDRSAHLLLRLIVGQSAQIPTLGVEDFLRLDYDELGARGLEGEALRHLVGLSHDRRGAKGQDERQQNAGNCGSRL